MIKKQKGNRDSFYSQCIFEHFIAYYQALSISPDISPLENTESVLYNFLNKQKGAFHGKSALYH